MAEPLRRDTVQKKKERKKKKEKKRRGYTSFLIRET